MRGSRASEEVARVLSGRLGGDLQEIFMSRLAKGEEPVDTSGSWVNSLVAQRRKQGEQDLSGPGGPLRPQ